MLSLISEHPELAAERQPGGRLDRALSRDRRLKAMIDECRYSDDKYILSEAVKECFNRVLIKTVQGLYFSLYERIVPRQKLEVLALRDQRFTTLEDVIDEIRPPRFRDITADPLPEITPNGWVANEPVFIVELQPIGGGFPVKKLFRILRDTSPDFIILQPDIFCFAFMKAEDGSAVCVIDVWKTLVAAVAAPWPDRRGPLRRGRKNPFSRSGESHK